MEADLLKATAQAAGIGGIALGIVLLVFRDIIRKKIFPTLDRERGFQLLKLVALLTWSVALLGIAAWAWVETQQKGPEESTPSNISIKADSSAVSLGDMSGSSITINAPTTIGTTREESSE